MLVKSETREIIDAFVEASKAKDLDLMAPLLSDDGEFQIQDKKGETQTTNKAEFLKWYTGRLSECSITSVAYDQCLDCVIGGPVALLNDGTFPRLAKDISERGKSGLRFECTDGLISEINFCFVFLKTENSSSPKETYALREFLRGIIPKE
jgi:hypothetical protein